MSEYLTIHFSQCGLPHRFFHEHKYVSKDLPVEFLCRNYEACLLDGTFKDEIATYDEHLLLIAQYLKRRGKLDVKFVSHCNCGGKTDERVIELDEQGDFTDDPHHGFFGQRLKYLLHSSNHFRCHVPGWIDADDTDKGKRFAVESRDDFLAIPRVSQAMKHREFTKLTQHKEGSQILVMAHYQNGEHWVIGFLDETVDFLEAWQRP